MKNLLLSGFIIIFAFSSGFSQTDDNISWSSLSLKKKFDQKNSLTITPTIRHNNNLKSYQNSSVDIHFAHSIDKHWSFGFITRTWFVPDAGDRQFLWFDFRYQTNIKTVKFFTGMRYHLALDIDDRLDADFLRWKTKFTFPNIGIITPHIAIEPWFRLNGFEELQRYRFEPAVDLKLQDDLKFTIMYRREETINLKESRRFNMYVFKLGYTI